MSEDVQAIQQGSSNQSFWENAFDEWDQWDEVIELIEDGKCILMLGPNISASPDTGKPYIEMFSQTLINRLKNDSLDPSNFSKVAATYKHATTNTQFYNRVKKYYAQNLNPSNIFKYIAKMPFPLIINTSPDHLLKEAYDSAIFDYYNYKENRNEPTSSGTPKHPLIYNLFGSAVEPESLVFTEKDRLDFLVNSIKRDPPIPKNLLNDKIMNNNNMFLFVGFDFNEWYLRLLLNILSLNNDRFACAIDRHDAERNDDARVFYTHNFNLSFLDAPFDIFIKKLYEKYIERNPFLEVIEENSEESRAIVQRKKSIGSKVPEVLITASMVDKDFVVQLEKSLQPAVTNEKLNTWDGSKIKSGNVREQMATRIAHAEIIILCLSPDSLLYLINEDLISLLELRSQEDESIKVIPILYKKCRYHDIPYLKDLAIFPKDETDGSILQISAWAEKADAYEQIAETIIQNLEA